MVNCNLHFLIVRLKMEGSSKNAESFGMMDGTYFVSKGVILDWMNELLKLNLTKIEQCATGAVYC